jgi:hypothetical protein
MNNLQNQHSYNDQDLGFDTEDLGNDESDDLPIEPFDPKKVEISISTPNLAALVSRLTHDEIDLIPDFQRSGDLWKDQIQSRLIESILVNLPIPAFYFDAIAEDKWQVVDGLQRLTAIKKFVNNELPLKKLEFLTDLNDLRYSELSRPLQRRFEEFQTTVYLIKPSTPWQMKYSLFYRINTGGLKLNSQEIRHAMSQSVNNGDASKFLKNLAEGKDFTRVVSNRNYRMNHNELILRHVSFVLLGVKNYKSSLPRFLDQGMLEISKINGEQKKQIKDNFDMSLKIAYEIFENNAFKKCLAKPDYKQVVNKPLFEVVTVCFASIPKDSQIKLLDNKKIFLDKFKNLLNNMDFDISISKSTANTESVNARFKMVDSLIKEILESN